MKRLHCSICKKEFLEDDLISVHGIRREIERIIKSENPEWNEKSRICKDDFDTYKIKYVIKIIEEEKGVGSIKALEDAVINSIKANDIITVETDIEDKDSKIGDRISDRVASFGGSWRFIILFFTILFAWIVINTFVFLSKPFDPYPFILLNLVLSCLAAIQAPIIMMSQNRQEMKDRIRSENDYKVNLKSEIEIRTLHEKIDHLLLVQWSKMMKVQEIQIEILEKIRDKLKK